MNTSIREVSTLSMSEMVKFRRTVPLSPDNNWGSVSRIVGGIIGTEALISIIDIRHPMLIPIEFVFGTLSDTNRKRIVMLLWLNRVRSTSKDCHPVTFACPCGVNVRRFCHVLPKSNE